MVSFRHITHAGMQMSDIIDFEARRREKADKEPTISPKKKEAETVLDGILSVHRQSPGDHLKVSLELFKIMCREPYISAAFGEKQLWVSGNMPTYVKLTRDELDHLLLQRKLPMIPILALLNTYGIIDTVE